MHLADSVRQKAMRIFTRLTRHIDMTSASASTSAASLAHSMTARSSRLVDHSSLFFVSRPRPSGILGGPASSFLKMRRKKSASLSFRFLGSLAPFVCTGWGGDSGSHITWKGVARGASPASSHAQSSTSPMLPIARLPFPSDLSRSGKV